METHVSPKIEQQLNILAAREGKNAGEVAIELLEEKLSEYNIISGPIENDANPEAMNQSIHKLHTRKPDHIIKARIALFNSLKQPRSLPAGRNLLDVICGKWLGNETDDEIHHALKDLS